MDAPERNETSTETPLSDHDGDIPFAATNHHREQSWTDNRVSLQNRTRKACYPCSKRKIKCDRAERTPCSNCARRPHSELCTFDDHVPRSNRVRSRQSAPIRLASSSPAVSQPVGYSTTPSLLHGIHNSSTAYDHLPEAHTQDHGQRDREPLAEDIGKTPTPIPTNSARFRSVNKKLEFTPTHGLPNGDLGSNYTPVSGFAPFKTGHSSGLEAPDIWGQTKPLLPPPKHVIKYIHIYRTLCSPIYSVIPDPEEFEARVCIYLEDPLAQILEAEFQHLPANALEERLAWLALVCAATATGVQFSDLKRAERRALVQQYFRNAMKLLQLSNYLLRPKLTSIMTFLLLCRILQNEFEPESAWSLLGTVARLVATIDLGSTSPYMDHGETIGETAENKPGKIWSKFLWQELAYCLYFGRSTDHVPIRPSASPPMQCLTYFDCMDNLNYWTISVDRLRSETESGGVLDYFDYKTKRDSQALPRLVDKARCRAIQDRLEYYLLRLHEDYAEYLLEMRRHEDKDDEPGYVEEIMAQCIQAYIDLRSFSDVPCRSWDLTFCAVSCALTLSALKSPRNSFKIESLIKTLLDLLDHSDDGNDESSRTTMVPYYMSWPARYPEAIDRLRRRVSAPESSFANGNGNGGGSATGYGQEPADVQEELDVFFNPGKMWKKYFSSLRPMAHLANGEGGGEFGPLQVQQSLYGSW